MCGIEGYVGRRQAAPLVVQGLHRLEYRGYDSAGIAVLTDVGIERCRKLGKLNVLETALEGAPLAGTAGIGHTRWATHGAPSEENAHPHFSANKRVAVVHNGVIENHNELRAELEAEGFRFSSGTDTEVVAHLVEKALREGAATLKDAVATTVGQLRGTYALAIISADYPGEIVSACLSSPLILGFGAEGILLSSDEVGFNGCVSSILALKDGEIATLRADGTYSVQGVTPEKLASRILPANMSLEDIDKGGFEHLMLKEIYDQPQAIFDALRGRILPTNDGVKLGGIQNKNFDERLALSRRILIVACGTSFHAALVGKRLIEEFAHMPAEVVLASEFVHEIPLINQRDALIGISQSGATFDTLRAVELAKKRGALTIGVTNRVGSELAELTHAGVYLHVGPECAVASTKAFTGQVAILALIATRLAYLRGLNHERIRLLVEGVKALPEWIASALQTRPQIQALVAMYHESQRAMFIGRGYGAPLALEGALKLKEVAYVDAHGYVAGELKHGSLALVEEGTPVIAVAFKDALQPAMFTNMEEAKARGARLIALATKGDAAVRAVAHHVIELPAGIPPELSAVVGAIPLQLLAYEWGVALGCDVDQPRNLAKSVTTA